MLNHPNCPPIMSRSVDQTVSVDISPFQPLGVYGSSWPQQEDFDAVDLQPYDEAEPHVYEWNTHSNDDDDFRTTPSFSPRDPSMTSPRDGRMSPPSSPSSSTSVAVTIFTQLSLDEPRVPRKENHKQQRPAQGDIPGKPFNGVGCTGAST
jgi:hypothetical protein